MFTKRETEVFIELLSGATNPEIAEKLVISIHTAKAHVNNIIYKLKAKNRVEAVAKGLKIALTTNSIYNQQELFNKIKNVLSEK